MESGDEILNQFLFVNKKHFLKMRFEINIERIKLGLLHFQRVSDKKNGGNKLSGFCQLFILSKDITYKLLIQKKKYS